MCAFLIKKYKLETSLSPVEVRAFIKQSLFTDADRWYVSPGAKAQRYFEGNCSGKKFALMHTGPRRGAPPFYLTGTIEACGDHSLVKATLRPSVEHFFLLLLSGVGLLLQLLFGGADQWRFTLVLSGITLFVWGFMLYRFYYEKPHCDAFFEQLRSAARKPTA